jgi:sialate O-acetylesterase
VNEAATVKGDVEKIAYYLELQEDKGGWKWLFVSMDPFTKDLTKAGIPTFASRAKFQQAVTGVSVLTNVKGIPTREEGEGALEFWPSNYGPVNQAKVEGASDEIYDWGDQTFDPEDGYGSMQVNLPKAGVTLFAINNWRAGPGADIGIGNWDGKNKDWTFSGNAGSLPFKRLRVLVKLKP